MPGSDHAIKKRLMRSRIIKAGVFRGIFLARTWESIEYCRPWRV
jgi:hypothetical protein